MKTLLFSLEGKGVTKNIEVGLCPYIIGSPGSCDLRLTTMHHIAIPIM